MSTYELRIFRLTDQAFSATVNKSRIEVKEYETLRIEASCHTEAQNIAEGVAHSLALGPHDHYNLSEEKDGQL